MMEDKQESIDSISKAIVRVFYNLQKVQEPNEDGKTYSGSVSTRCLIESFGWSGSEVFEQHDIQEVTRILLDDLQEKMRDTSVSSVIPNLLAGIVESGIECINVEYNSFKQDLVYDIQLDVKGCRDIYASFDKYIKPELLTGDNKYHAEGHGLQDAKKYSMFTVLPKVLMLHLKRFDYTPFGTLQKVSDIHQFYDEIDLTKYVKQKAKKNKKEYKYHLHAVLIHKGSTVNSGHYVVAVNVSDDVTKKEWYLFDDERATKISPLDAIEANFGGAYNTAYMLAYVRHDAVQEVLSPMNREDIPDILRSTFKNDESGCSIM
ncbi:predicted protein [Naegleria gruberi]|uniref:Predicted protein n=1 Tax=Naegleria gruberi TaxID=5762 RepID=D2VKC7_NAEGR|nr:uncharacterized protein NAEGRDRAFT_58476 [Naegleria gruberi]EFC42577.1 predicted protein [Naegleria gruberi]|eukprot:XP_002675321.1 predicted protein [Naegleria gruberi strain NEG-M]